MAAIHTSGSIACFIFGGLLIVTSIINVLFAGTILNPFPAWNTYLLFAGFGAGLIALGWYIRVLSKKS